MAIECEEEEEPKVTQCGRWSRKEQIQSKTGPFLPKEVDSRELRIEKSTVSNAEVKSRKESRQSLPWSSDCRMSEVTLRTAVSDEWNDL